MDINNKYQSSNLSSMQGNSAGVFNYDLQNEKQEIEKITQEIKKELIAKWKKSYANAQIFPAAVAAMHPEARDFLLGFELVAIYDNISRQAGLDVKGRNALPKIVWQIALTKNWQNFDQVLEARVPMVHSMHMTVANLLQQNVLNKVRMLSEKPFMQKTSLASEAKKQNVQLPLADAMGKYPKLGEQNVTMNQLKLKYFPTPVRPSVKNWITDYHDNFGAGKHSPIDRGNFLFHSENGKTLSTFDRQKLGTVLKSLDEGIMLAIDPIGEVIIFENNNTEGTRIASGYPSAGGTDHGSRGEMGEKENVGGGAIGQVRQVGQIGKSREIEKRKIVENNFFQLPKNDTNPPASTRGDDRSLASIQQNHLSSRSGSTRGGWINANQRIANDANVPTQGSTEDKHENFSFRLPTSRPEIGSSEFDANGRELKNELVANQEFKVNREGGVISGAQGGSGAGRDTIDLRNSQISKNIDLLNKPEQSQLQAGGMRKTEPQAKEEARDVFSAYNNVKWKPSENNAGQGSAVNQGNQDLLSDEMLFQKLQEKKMQAKMTANTSAQNVAPAGSISFSSPQRFGAEQKTSAAVRNPYHIAPAKRENASNDFATPKVQGNVVDLR